jgi:hypothetical protein
MPAAEGMSTSSVPSTSLTILSCFESGAAVGTEIKVGEGISVAEGMSASASRYKPRNSKLLPGTSQCLPTFRLDIALTATPLR